MYKAVIFDWGGVIAPEKGGGWLTWFAELLDMPYEEARAIWGRAYPGMNTGEISDETFWQRVETIIGRVLPDSKDDIWLKGIADQPWAEMLAFVCELQDKGIKTALLSNTINYEPLKQRLGTLYGAFDPIILSHEEGISKPNPLIFQRMLEKLELEASQCVFVDDKVANVEAAKSLGIAAVVAGEHPSATIQQLQALLQG